MTRYELENRLDGITESAFGRFFYKLLLPGLLVVMGFLGVRSINSIDAAITDLQRDSRSQNEMQIETQAEVRAIRATMTYQERYQTLVDKNQDQEIARHARALKID